MTPLRSFGFLAAAFLFFVSAGQAETWSDISGNFQIEADFVGVEGKSIVLKKADGNTISVPIDRLSPESRALAKRLYDMGKSGGDATDTTPGATPGAAPATESEPTASATSSPATPLAFTPPAPVTTEPMPAFPDDASLQETVDFIQAQVIAGHPEVFWYALPEELRTALDSDELRSTLAPAIQEQAQLNQQTEQVVMKLVQVLLTKKEFVLNSPMMGQVPGEVMQLVQQGYDPAVGIVFELATLSFSGENLEKMTFTELVDHHGPRIGGHLAELLEIAPPEMVDEVFGKITVKETSDTTGTITVPNDEGGTETTEMVKYEGRWLPKEFAEQWEAKKETLIDEMVAQVNQAKNDPQAAQQANMMIGMFVGMANGVLDPMLTATNQQEFDQAVMQVVGMLGAFGGGPGGPGPGGPGPGGPGGPGGFGGPPPGGFGGPPPGDFGDPAPGDSGAEEAPEGFQLEVE